VSPGSTGKHSFSQKLIGKPDRPLFGRQQSECSNI